MLPNPRVHRRTFLLGGLAAVSTWGLVGCADEPAASGTGTVPTSDVVATGSGSSTSAAAGGSPAAAGGDTKPFTTQYGVVDLPQNPQRVVTMYPTGTDIALALGLPIVAAPGATGGANQPFAAHQADQLQGVTRIAASFEPDFEQIAAQRPDVIMDDVLSTGDEAGYRRLSGIAPVFAYEPTDWRDYLRVAGAAFGREDRVQGIIDAYDADLVDIKTQLGTRWQGKTFASVFTTDTGVIVAATNQQVETILAQDLGLTLHPLSKPPGEDRTELSAENLSQLDADVLFVAVYPKEDSLERDRTNLDALQRQPLWERLPAVQAGQVFEFSGECVYTSPANTRVVLGEIVAALTA